MERTFVITMVFAALWLLGNLVAGIPPTGPDAMDHMQWITQFVGQVDSGIWYPRWLGQSFGGFGLPVFYIYPPLAYYFAWLVHLLNHGWPAEELWRIVSTAAILLSIGSGYLYFRSYAANRAQAIIAALVFVALPYRYWDVLVRCAYSESLVFVFLPLLFLVIDRTFERSLGSRRSIAWTALLTAVLLMTSASSAAVLSLGVPFYVVAKWWASGRPALKQIAVPLVMGLVLGLGCAAIWILPAFHFRPLVQTDLAYDPGFGRMYDIIAIFVVNRSNLVFVPMLMSVIGYIAIPIFVANRQSFTINTKAWLWLGLLIVFLQVPLSWPVWNTLPMLRVAQFSARWGLLMSMVLPVGYLVLRPSTARSVFLLSTAILTIFSLMHAYPTLASSWTFKGYDNHHPPQMDAFEYLPRSVEKGGWKTHLLGLERSTPEVTVDGGIGRVLSVERHATSTRFRINASTTISVTLARFYWPEWRLYPVVEDRRSESDSIALFPTHNGFIRASLPAGNSEYYLKLETSDTELLGRWISAASLLLTLGLLMIGRQRVAASDL